MEGGFWELEGKRAHDFRVANVMKSSACVWVPGPIIIGAGPSGLAVAACLKQRGVPSLVLERADCIGSLWKNRTYDRLRLHLPKKYCELPSYRFPKTCPTYPTKQQFVAYLDAYAEHFDIRPAFNRTVVSTEFNHNFRLWQVRTVGIEYVEVEYMSRWVVVATGENAVDHFPQLEGLEDFGGPIIHSSSYKSGEQFTLKRVLVVGCGNSGMEVSLDLCNYNALPSLAVRDSVHVLPQKMLGKSTFGLSMLLLRWFPTWLVDRFLLLMTYFILGDTTKYGLHRPRQGPLELKNRLGKTPVLDVGTLSNIKSGRIKVFRGVKRIKGNAVEFVDGKVENFDAIVLATGYKSNVASWLKETDMSFEEGDAPSKPFMNGWKGENGLYAAGFTRHGLLGASNDALRIAEDIHHSWMLDETKHYVAFPASRG
ncbi:hypothetical protein MLD38_006610 [Melastoma candidum]|uniref:Uncharacterized protein n=1 Tax=Melastoma candidum TaxID=119954 RepID=A0ACB9RN06_9MYRT|nr:hypothetical protein MLD38_006610 [Melastoma candidum]